MRKTVGLCASRRQRDMQSNGIKARPYSSTPCPVPPVPTCCRIMSTILGCTASMLPLTASTPSLQKAKARNTTKPRVNLGVLEPCCC